MTENTEYKRLNPKCRIAMYIGYAVMLAILAIGEFATLALFGKDLPSWTWIICVAIFAACLVYAVIAPIIFYRRYRYIITSDKVDVRRGIIIVRHTVVPIERIHQVEVVSGPINNMLGLADVNITTAGGIATIEYLEKDVADTVAEELNRVVEKILKDRKKND
jgi:membrane protein YdbS with pleckstrin-like domain